MSIHTIVLAVMGGIAAVVLLFGLIRGLRRGFARSLARLVTLVIAAAASFILTVVGIQKTEPLIEGTVKPYLLERAAAVADIFSASPSMLHYVVEVVCFLAAPIIFLLIFCVMRFVTWLLYLIVAAFLPKKKRTNRNGKEKRYVSGISRLAGMAVSSVSAVLIIIALLMPFAGYLTYGSHLYSTLETSQLVAEGTLPPEVEGELVSLPDNPAVKLVNLLGGAYLFDALVTMEDGESHATDEIDTLLSVVPHALSLAEIDWAAVFEGEGGMDLSAIDEGILPAVGHSPLLCQILAELMSTAATKWHNGETFLGISVKDQLPETYMNALDAVLVHLSQASRDSVIGDMQSLSTTLQLVSETYAYMMRVDDVINYTHADLENHMDEILATVTPETAAFFASAISIDFVGVANLEDDSTRTVQRMMTDALENIAEMDGEERTAEAEAINNLVTYSSGVRQNGESAVDATQIVDTLLSSSAVMGAIDEMATPDPETGETETVTITAEQRLALTEALAERALTATPEELAQLASIDALFVAG